MVRPTSGLRTYSVSATAAGTARPANAAPRHRRFARQASTSAAVSTVTGPRPPRPASRCVCASYRPRVLRTWASTTASRPSGRAWPANASARDAVTAAHPVTSTAAGPRSAGGSSGRGAACRRSFVPRGISPAYGDAAAARATASRLQAARPGDRLGSDQGSADLELDLGVLGQRDVARVAVVDLAVVDGRDAPLGRAGLARPQRLPPHVEEVAQREGPVDRRLDMDDAVGGVRMQPVEALPAADERALRGVLGLRPGYSEAGRYLARRAVHNDGQMSVDVEQHLLAGVAVDAIHRRAGGLGSGAGQREGARDGNALGAVRARGRSGLERAQRAQRGELRRRRSGASAAGRRAPGRDRERDADG